MVRKIIAALLLIFWPSCLLYGQMLQAIVNSKPPASGGQVTLFSDAFGGTAGTALPTYDATHWANAGTNQCNNLKISTPNGGVASGGNESCDLTQGFSPTNNQFAQATLVAIPVSEFMVCVRLASVGNNPNGYCAGANPNISSTTYYLIAIGGTGTLTTVAQTPTVNDVINLQVIGSLITVKVNGTAIITNFSDTQFTTGTPGMLSGDATSVTARMSTFSAGSAT